jgi:hypothetical protein
VGDNVVEIIDDERLANGRWQALWRTTFLTVYVMQTQQ